MDIVEFLLLRIAEDEAEAGSWYLDWGGNMNPMKDRVMAECIAKRLMIEDCAQIVRDGDGEVGYDVHSLLVHMSRPYADHPDYHWTWRAVDDQRT